MDIELKHDKDIMTMTLGRNDSRSLLAVGNGKETVRVWNFLERKIIKDIKGCCYSDYSVSIIQPDFSPDLRYLAVRYEQECLIYNTEDFSLF